MPHYEVAGAVEYRLTVRSLKRYKNSKEYRDDLRRAAAKPVSQGSSMAARKARLSRLEAETELDLLMSGASPDVYRGLVRLPTAEPD